MIYHVFYLFNGVGIPGSIPNAKNIPFLDVAACVIYPWFMVLLFVVSGMSARYALQKRTEAQFLKERARKLLIPSTLGLFVIHWITGFLNIQMGGGLAYIPAFLVYPISAISGIGPLWFIQMLFLFCCVVILLRKLDPGDRLWRYGQRASAPVLLLLFVPIWGAAQILNLPVLTMYRFGIYMVSFLTGYYIFSHDAVQDTVERIRIPLGCIALPGAVIYAVRYGGSNFTASSCLQSLHTNLYLWIAVLTVIGWAKHFGNRETAFSRYLSKSSFGIYILHYPVLIAICYMLTTYWDLPAIWNYTLALVLEWVLTFSIYEAVKRTPVVRYLILGMKSERKAGS